MRLSLLVFLFISSEYLEFNSLYASDSFTSLSDILAEYLREKYRQKPFELARVKVILPTRRACQTLRESFLKQNDCTQLLPQMKALYDMDDMMADIKPAISDWERLFLLTQLSRKCQ